MNQFWKEIIITQICSGSVSFIASSMIVTFIARKKNQAGGREGQGQGEGEGGLSSPYRRIIFGLSISDMFQSFGLVTGPILSPSPGNNNNYNMDNMDMDTQEVSSSLWGMGNKHTCQFAGLLFMVGITAVPMYTLCLCIYYVCKLKLKMTDDQFVETMERKMHMIILFVNTSLYLTALNMDVINPSVHGNVCHVSPMPTGCRQYPEIVGECDPRDRKAVRFFNGVGMFVVPMICFIGIMCSLAILFWNVILREKIFGQGYGRGRGRERERGRGRGRGRGRQRRQAARREHSSSWEEDDDDDDDSSIGQGKNRRYLRPIGDNNDMISSIQQEEGSESGGDDDDDGDGLTSARTTNTSTSQEATKQDLQYHIPANVAVNNDDDDDDNNLARAQSDHRKIENDEQQEAQQQQQQLSLDHAQPHDVPPNRTLTNPETEHDPAPVPDMTSAVSASASASATDTAIATAPLTLTRDPEAISRLYKRELVTQACCYSLVFLLSSIPIANFLAKLLGDVTNEFEQSSSPLSPSRRILWRITAVVYPLGGFFNIIIYTRLNVASFRRRHPDCSRLQAFWLVFKAGGEMPNDDGWDESSSAWRICNLWCGRRRRGGGASSAAGGGPAARPASMSAIQSNENGGEDMLEQQQQRQEEGQEEDRHGGDGDEESMISDVQFGMKSKPILYSSFPSSDRFADSAVSVATVNRHARSGNGALNESDGSRRGLSGFFY